jgi:hypothetical protein
MVWLNGNSSNNVLIVTAYLRSMGDISTQKSHGLKVFVCNGNNKVIHLLKLTFYFSFFYLRRLDKQVIN